MTAPPIRAVYENGLLRPLQPVHLSEGQEVELVVLTEREQAAAALADLLITHPAHDPGINIDTQALLDELDATYQGPPVSEAIIKERRSAP